MPLSANPGLMPVPGTQTNKQYELPKNIQDIQKKRQQTLLDQFANTRAMVSAQKDETNRLSQNSLDRYAAISGLSSGAAEKAKQEASKNIGEGFAQTEAGIGAQEAAAKDQLAAQEQQMLQSGGQFQQQLDFQKDSFAQQMKMQWAEFDENLKTNLVNTAIAAKQAGIRSNKDWSRLYEGLTGVYGNRVSSQFAPGNQQETSRDRGLRYIGNKDYTNTGWKR